MYSARPFKTLLILIRQVFMRCERQTFCRLPRTKAALFFIRTCVYPISEVREEGLGHELANAIHGLRSGSDPGIFSYKVGEVWAKLVTEYLRSEVLATDQVL